MKLKKILGIWLLFCSFSCFISGEMNARLIRYPDVSYNQIVFVYGGDIWIVSKKGGTANRLSSPSGMESFPKFSPDGKNIAFSGNYDGNIDVYTIPSEGGTIERITHHGGSDRVLGWYPDGKKILFASTMYSENPYDNKIFNVKKNGGLPEKLSVPYGEFASFSKCGRKIAYTKKTRIFRTWKRYRGGWAADIWIFDLNSFKAKNITNNDANDELPMWHKSKIYYLSDRGKNKRYNLWEYDIHSGKNQQLTTFCDFDVHFPSIGPEDIVFVAGGKPYLFSLINRDYHPVQIQVISDNRSIKPINKKVGNLVENVHISPDGNRALVEARGEIFSLPAKHGYIKNLTRNSGSAQRHPAWSPDGKTIAFWSDQSGEYQLYTYDLITEKKIIKTSFKKGYRYHIFWSPDSKKIAFIDHSITVWLFDLKKNSLKKVDQGKYMGHWSLNEFSISWSKDSNWIAYSLEPEDRGNALFLYNLSESKKFQVTGTFFKDSNPVFVPEGKYLFFTTNRHFKPIQSPFDYFFTYANSTNLAVVSLRDNVDSLLKIRNDTMEQKKESNPDQSKKTTTKKQKNIVKIDIENFENRMEILPVKPGKFSDLSALKDKLVYVRYSNDGSALRKKSICYYDFKKREEKKIIEGMYHYVIAANKKKMIVGNWKKFGIINIDPNQKMEYPLNLKDLSMVVDPRLEWEQIFKDAWRIQRDYFYDPNLHGVDWQKIYKQYQGLLKYVVTRSDLNFLIGEMIGELNSSHTFVSGGEMEKGKTLNVGYLGINWKKKQNHYCIAEILSGGPLWNNEIRSPLDKPGLNIKKGTFILSVNGVEININKDPYAYFQGLGGKTVELTINSQPFQNGAKKIIVKALNSEVRLRLYHWIERNRQRVNKATNGKIGYIYIEDMMYKGFNEFMRQFYAQRRNKRGLIIDERFNGGGFWTGQLIDMLNKKPLVFWKSRYFSHNQMPSTAECGPKVMLMNGISSSAGDVFPYCFRKVKLGPLIGTRTWGGVLSLGGTPVLIDGGRVTSPNQRMYDLKGNWFKEGHGVDPDIVVEDDPSQMAHGQDPQLEKAIEVVMELLKKYPYIQPKDPDYENRSQ